MSTPITSHQIPSDSLLDLNGKQAYLGNSYVAAVNATSIVTTTETPLLLLTNPATNTKAAFLDLKRVIALTASDSAVLNVYVGPTVTNNGTPLTPSNLRSGFSNNSQMNVYTSPTVSANGTLLDSLASLAFNPGESDLLQIVDPGSSILVTVVASANPTKVTALLSWYEE